MSSKDSIEGFTDSKKCHCLSRSKQIRNIFSTLNIKLENSFETKRLLRKCAGLLARNSVYDLNLVDVVNSSSKRMLLESIDIELAHNMLLIINCIGNLSNLSMEMGAQLQKDINHHNNFSCILKSIFNEVPKAPENKIDLGNSNTDNNRHEEPHKKVLNLKKEIIIKKNELEKIRTHILEFEGLPPDLEVARKMLDEAKSKLNQTNKEIESSMWESFLETSSSSFSP